MKSQESTDEARKRVVKAAQSALRANPGADFNNLLPHLRPLLGNLPVLQADATVLQVFPAGKAAELNLEGALNFLRQRWIETRVTETESIGLASIAEEPELLSLTFYGNIWSVGSMEERLTVARIAEDKFCCWRYHESGGIGGAIPGEYETPDPANL